MRIGIFLLACPPGTFLPDFLAEHRRVVPGETQFRIGSIPTKSSECFRPILIAVEKNVAFRYFDES